MLYEILAYRIFGVTVVMTVTLFFASCKKDKTANPMVEYPVVELECDTFSNRHVNYYLAPRLTGLTVHKRDPSVIVYSIFTGTDEKLYYLNLSENKEVLLFTSSLIGSIDLNKYGELIIACDNNGRTIMLGNYDNPASLKKVTDEDFYGIINANWLNDGDLFTYSTTYSPTPPIIFRDRQGKKISEKYFTDSIFAVLDEVEPGKWLTTSYVRDGSVSIGTCDTSLKNYKLLFKTYRNSMLTDLEFNQQANKLIVMPFNELFQVDLSNGKFEASEFNCENIFVDAIDYCPANGQYYLCIRQPKWEDGMLNSFTQYLCRSTLRDRKIEVLKEIQ